MHMSLQVYGLKRLVRGLASGRQGARQGYALALTTLMSEVSTLPVTMVLDMLDKTLEVSGQAKARFSPYFTLTLTRRVLSCMLDQSLQIGCTGFRGPCISCKLSPLAGHSLIATQILLFHIRILGAIAACPHT